MEENHKHADKREKSLLAAAVCVAGLGIGDANHTPQSKN